MTPELRAALTTLGDSLDRWPAVTLDKLVADAVGHGRGDLGLDLWCCLRDARGTMTVAECEAIWQGRADWCCRFAPCRETDEWRAELRKDIWSALDSTCDNCCEPIDPADAFCDDGCYESWSEKTSEIPRGYR